MSRREHGLIGHTRLVQGRTEIQTLSDHLRGVADRAAEFSTAFDAEAWGYRAGLWHDLGKSSDAFQDYIRAANDQDSHQLELRGRVDHSTAGAQHANNIMGPLGHLLAYPIAGHHSGLLDSIAAGACQQARLEKDIPATALPDDFDDPTGELQLPKKIAEMAKDPTGFAFTLAFFTRMIFSSIVDADFLDTESFVDPDRAAHRPAYEPDILDAMECALDRRISLFPDDGSDVTKARRQVHQACLSAADQPPGFFSLTVPTGGGKTLSSLAFGLRHARKHGLRRVIYAIPFTSIIEQNAGVFREAMKSIAGDVVLEHHCSAQNDPDRDQSSRLASENWDAPLVVTTTVQLYESLFSNRPSRCRKLHNVVNSVVILDEAQSIPVDLMQPILRALEQLVHGYGVTVVLCTATQPAIIWRDSFGIGIDINSVREIIPDPVSLYKTLERVVVEDVGPLPDESLVDRLRIYDRVLCVVNTRSHARELFDQLSGEEGVFHLSAQMCPAHRSSVLQEIRDRLESGNPCRLISTQLIEAGVDIDFPVVFRSMAGLDSIAQAAGRCNRNGKLADHGRLFVFSSEHAARERFISETANVAAQVLPLHDNPLDLDTIEHYFRLYYWEQKQRWDARGIMQMFDKAPNANGPLPLLFDFKKTDKAFHLMEQTAHTVFVPWGEQGANLCRRLRFSSDLPARSLLRQLQRFQVGIPERVYMGHLGRDIELVHDRFAVLIDPLTHYRNDTGLALDQVRGGLLTV